MAFIVFRGEKHSLASFALTSLLDNIDRKMGLRRNVNWVRHCCLPIKRFFVAFLYTDYVQIGAASSTRVGHFLKNGEQMFIHFIAFEDSTACLYTNTSLLNPSGNPLRT